MERIKEAVERARKVRAGESVPERTADTAPRSDPAPQSRNNTASGVIARQASSEDEAVGTIQYSQSKVVQLDQRHLEANRIISLRKSDSRTVSFDRLRTQLMRIMRENGWRTLAVTSPGAKNGKTTVALNLAMSIAQQTEQTVLLADFDLRDPRISQYLGLPKTPSLDEYFRGEVELSDVFVNPGIQRLTLLPNFRRIENAAEILMTSRMKHLVADIRNRYESRLVIFDLPALLTTDDALAFLPQVDCVLLVVSNGFTKKSELKEAMTLLQNTPIVGTVLNRSDEAVHHG